MTLTFNLKIYRYLSLLILHLFIKYESCMLESTQDNVSKLKYWQCSVVTLTFNLLTPKCIGIFLLSSCINVYNMKCVCWKLLKLSCQKFNVFYTHKYNQVIFWLTSIRGCAFIIPRSGFHDFKGINNKFNVNVSHCKAPVAVLEYQIGCIHVE